MIVVNALRLNVSDKVNADIINESRDIFVVEIGENKYVDVMYNKTEDLIFVIESVDGGHVFDADGVPLNESVKNQSEIIDYIKKYIKLANSSSQN